MSYKTILVHVNNGRRCEARLAMASQLARTFDSHLVGLYAESEFRMPPHAAALAGSGFQEIVTQARRDAVAEAERTFQNHAKRNGDLQAEWRSSPLDAVDAVSLHGRYADLIVIGQSNDDDGSNLSADFPERVLLSSGRPLLIVPYAGSFPTAGERILLCWSATRESTRAVNDALPFLQKAKQVHVATFNPRATAHGDVPGADIGLFLARHGVKVEVSEYRAPDLDVGSQILSRAMDIGSDLIVMGGYGHSRVHELFLGGVSRTMLEAMTVPVLMSH